jgi:serine/threonine protein kinase
LTNQIRFSCYLIETDEETESHISPYATHYFSIIRWMTTKDPKQRSTLTEVTEQMKLLFPVPAISSIEELEKIEDIHISTEHLIGKGGQAVVFLGLSKGSIVAVKRIIIDSLTNKEKESVYKERDLFQKLNHRNIIKLIDSGKNKTFM